MMIRTILALALLASVSSMARAEGGTPSRVERVVVYPDGAAVTRRLTVSLPAGPGVVVLDALPAGLDPASLAVSGAAEGKLAIVSVDSRDVPGDPAAKPDREGAAKLEALRAERAGVAGAIEAAETEKAAIRRFGESAPDKLAGAGAPDPERWPAIWAALGKGMAEVNTRLRPLEAKAAELDAAIAAAERAFEKRTAGPGGTAPRREVRISVEAGAPLTADLTVTYRVPNAGWTPVYDAALKLDGEKPALSLVRRALVTQRTGEDWTGVALSLSTTRVRRGTAAPVLNPVTLSLWDPAQDAVLRGRMGTSLAAPSPRLAEPAAAPPVMKESAEKPVVPVEAALDSTGYQATFSLPGTVDVPADGTSKSVRLSSQESEPTLSVKVAPELDTTAYLEAAFTPDGDAPLLAGDVLLTRDGAFIGKGRFAFVAAGDTAKLGFGADDGVKVTRAPVRKRENDGGFLNATRTDTQEFRDTVKNLHRFPVRIVLQERLPVSENTAITVDALASNTAATEKPKDDERGVATWAWDVKPGETRDVRWGWRVRWPTDRDLVRKEARTKN